MSGNKLFVDTNAILYLLAGDKTLADLLDGKNIHLSFITQLELLGFKKLDLNSELAIKDFLSKCTVVDINHEIKEIVIDLRKRYNAKLPDCIIMASSIFLDIPIITADSDFKHIEELDLLFYEKS